MEIDQNLICASLKRRCCISAVWFWLLSTEAKPLKIF